MQRFEDNTPSNTLKSRALGAIALSPTGNAQGDYYFMLPATGKKLSRHSWTVLLMTDTVIARVEAIALYQRPSSGNPTNPSLTTRTISITPSP